LTFRDLLTAFAAAVEANDGEGLASLFTKDGTYDDGFFGAHTGRAAIAMMLQRFHDTGRAYLWEFLDPLSDGSIGYARFRFSYASLLAMRKICMSGSMSGVWKRSQGRTSEAPPDERGGNRYVRPTATAPHLDSTKLRPVLLSSLGQHSNL
jgi:hypothetical protein